MSKIDILSQAIARYEGFDVTVVEAQFRRIAFPTLSQRHNNPGDLMFAGQIGAVKGEPHGNGWYAHFPSVAAGWAALRRQIELDASRGFTLSAFMAKYAPAEDANDPKSYCAFVCGKLNVTPETKLSDALIDPLPAIVGPQPE